MSVPINDLLEPKAHRKGRLCVTGTGTTVHRIAVWYKMGMSPEEISREFVLITTPIKPKWKPKVPPIKPKKSELKLNGWRRVKNKRKLPHK